MSTLVIIASVQARPGKADALCAALKALLHPTLAEDGCLRYEANVSDDGQTWYFAEMWESRELWDRHMASPHIAHYRSIVHELVEFWNIFEGSLVRPAP